ncbi:unnamed protein product, partial [Cyprideis torosa]
NPALGICPCPLLEKSCFPQNPSLGICHCPLLEKPIHDVQSPFLVQFLPSVPAIASCPGDYQSVSYTLRSKVVEACFLVSTDYVRWTDGGDVCGRRNNGSLAEFPSNRKLQRSWRPAFSSPPTTFGGPMEETSVGDGTTDRWLSSLQAGSCRRSRTSSPPCPIQRRTSSGTAHSLLSLVNHEVQPLQIEGLANEVIGSKLHGLNRGFYIAMACDHDNLNMWYQILEPDEQVKIPGVREQKIHDDDIVPMSLNEGQSLPGICSGRHLPFLVAELLDQEAPNCFLVVNHQNRITQDSTHFFIPGNVTQNFAPPPFSLDRFLIKTKFSMPYANKILQGRLRLHHQTSSHIVMKSVEPAGRGLGFLLAGSEVHPGLRKTLQALRYHPQLSGE